MFEHLNTKRLLKISSLIVPSARLSHHPSANWSDGRCSKYVQVFSDPGPQKHQKPGLNFATLAGIVVTELVLVLAKSKTETLNNSPEINLSNPLLKLIQPNLGSVNVVADNCFPLSFCVFGHAREDDSVRKTLRLAPSFPHECLELLQYLHRLPFLFLQLLPIHTCS